MTTYFNIENQGGDSMKPTKNNDKQMFLLFALISFVAISYIACYYAAASATIESGALIDVFPVMQALIEENPVNLNYIDFKMIMLSAVAVALVGLSMWVKSFEINPKTPQGKEHGSARWNDDLKTYNKTFVDEKEDKNMILGQNLFLSMDGFKTRKNNNILVNGGSGSGKSRFVIKPNILQNAGYSSMVITDPSGELLQSTGSFLEQKGYKVKVFNLNDMSYSNCYNPFNYIRDEIGVSTLVHTFIKNTTESKGGDDFWVKSETALLTACCFYLIECCPRDEQNFGNIITLINCAKVNEDDPDEKSVLDNMMDELEERDAYSNAVKYYKIFKQGAGKTAKSILISAAVRLGDFNIPMLQNLTNKDTLELEKMGDEKTALFVIIPAANTKFNYLVAMMYSQLFETLYHTAENSPGLHLKVPVRFLLDEFPNIGTIPDFAPLLATMRKYWISCTIIIQNMAQIKTMFKDSWETIVGNCDTFIFLGGNELNTTKYVSELLGKTTIKVKNRSNSNKGGGSTSLNASGRELMTPGEIGKLKDDECIVKIKGIDPFFVNKFDYPKHKNYKYTGDCNSELLYEVKEHFSTTSDLLADETVVKTKRDDIVEKLKEANQDMIDEIIVRNTAEHDVTTQSKINNFDEIMLSDLDCESVEQFESILTFEESFNPNFEFEFSNEQIEALKIEDDELQMYLDSDIDELIETEQIESEIVEDNISIVDISDFENL